LRLSIGSFARPGRINERDSPEVTSSQYKLSVGCSNCLLSKLRVKSQHTSGILNGRWGSLQELLVGLASDAHASFAMDWIVACCVLHNVCVSRSDDLPRQPLADPSPSAIDDPEAGALPMRLQVQNVMSAFMREKGIYLAHMR